MSIDPKCCNGRAPVCKCTPLSIETFEEALRIMAESETPEFISLVPPRAHPSDDDLVRLITETILEECLDASCLHLPEDDFLGNDSGWAIQPDALSRAIVAKLRAEWVR